MTITVLPINDAPIAVNDYVPTMENVPVTSTVASNDIHLDGDVLTFTVITSVSASQGVLDFYPDGTFTFTPALNFNGILNIDYKTCDPAGACVIQLL